MKSLLLIFTLLSLNLFHDKTIQLNGEVTDSKTGETLIGTAILVTGTTQGTVTDTDGTFHISVRAGQSLTISYIGYTDKVVTISDSPNDKFLKISLDEDGQMLEQASITGRKNLETLQALQNERRNSSYAIENIGAKEMGIKGISNAKESVKKLSGVTIAGAGQLIVRGLGDRYSTTTLNNLPIASPNPDNKLIPLDIFPSSTIQSISVSKVYVARAYADYSGALVDISTKGGDKDGFLNISVGVGGDFNTICQKGLMMESHSMFRAGLLDKNAEKVAHRDFQNYFRQHDIFSDSPFVTKSFVAIPNLDGAIGFGHTFNVGREKLSLLATASIKSATESCRDAFFNTYEASGNQKSSFTYDNWAKKLDIAALVNLELSLPQDGRLTLTGFFARNAQRSFMLREGIDYEERELFGQNQTDHYYMLNNWQFGGHHQSGTWEMDWGVSASFTSSDEPDRRQMLFQKTNTGSLKFFTNNQETFRYFGKLREKEFSADFKALKDFDTYGKLRFGVAVKRKDRFFSTTRFLYDVNGITDEFNRTDEMNLNAWLGYDAIKNGLIRVDRKQNARDRYDADNLAGALFAEYEVGIADRLFINAGLRFEAVRSSVRYNDDVENAVRHLDSYDPFFAVNLKYKFNNSNFLRLSVSRTVTRPSFVEMAPFLYQESYGGAMLRGNADLKNGYNYNVDLRYEFLSSESSDMAAVTGYFKWLEDPIERIQKYSGGAPEHSFQNAEDGLAAGIEVEFRKQIVRDLNISANASYMYTNVHLPEGGVYTNPTRSLQGASPYMVNADITYTPAFSRDRALSLALMYNLQGPRIHAVGLSGLGDIMQMPFHSLDFNASWSFDAHFTLSLSFENMLNSASRFTQEIPQTGEKADIEGWRYGPGFNVGLKWKL